MATSTGTDLRELARQGKAPEVPQFLNDTDALKAWQDGADITVERVQAAAPDAKFEYWTCSVRVNGKGPFIWSAPYGPMRDELMEFMSVNAASAPFTGLQFANLDRSGEKPWLYLVIADL